MQVNFKIVIKRSVPVCSCRSGHPIFFIEMNGGTDMLKGIPEILSPELLKVLCEMGHSDRLVIADGNFPVESMGKNAITIRCDGHLSLIHI